MGIENHLAPQQNNEDNLLRVSHMDYSPENFSSKLIAGEKQ